MTIIPSLDMDYSSDLPINSMGRRVRSRLYFTSESHLHSLLNVLRISSFKENCVKSPLSAQGQQILADASELCYLTQVVMRLFEDPQKPLDDPKRFRVEIWFSPGATATPMHMEMMYRENDASRFDTEKLQKISIEGLSCTQVEEYFAEAMKDGKPTRSENAAADNTPKKKDKKKKEPKEKETIVEESQVDESIDDKAQSTEKQDSTQESPQSNGEANAGDETTTINLVEEQCVEPDEIEERTISKHTPVSSDTVRHSAMICGFALGATAIALLLFKGGRGLKK